MRTFTLDEANRLLPKVQEGLEEARHVLARLRDVRDQLTDLRIVWGDKIEQASCPDHAEYSHYRQEFADWEIRLRQALDQVSHLGCEVKDPDTGLVDFYADRGGDTVFLCWRRGEKRIEYWHTLEAGFAGRRPIQEF